VTVAKRRPLTGVLRVEWVDATNVDDGSTAANFGWFDCESQPHLDPVRLLSLLRTLADALEEDIQYGTADPFVPRSPR
jgi:hypothetical protein